MLDADPRKIKRVADPPALDATVIAAAADAKGRRQGCLDADADAGSAPTKPRRAPHDAAPEIGGGGEAGGEAKPTAARAGG